jgi:hypothetical protein
VDILFPLFTDYDLVIIPLFNVSGYV